MNKLTSEQTHCCWLSWCCFRKASSTTSRQELQGAHDDGKQVSTVNYFQRKPGGWKSMPFILGLYFTIPISLS